MKRVFGFIILCASLSACQQTSANISAYEASSQKRTVTLDDSKVAVVPVDKTHYVAWGGMPPKDKFVQYRQRRAIELVSGCRVKSVQSKKGDDLFQATVKC